MECDKYAESIMAQMKDDMLKGEYRLSPAYMRDRLAAAWLAGRADGWEARNRIAVRDMNWRNNGISQSN